MEFKPKSSKHKATSGIMNVTYVISSSSTHEKNATANVSFVICQRNMKTDAKNIPLIRSDIKLEPGLNVTQLQSHTKNKSYDFPASAASTPTVSEDVISIQSSHTTVVWNSVTIGGTDIKKITIGNKSESEIVLQVQIVDKSKSFKFLQDLDPELNLNKRWAMISVHDIPFYLIVLKFQHINVQCKLSFSSSFPLRLILLKEAAGLMYTC